MPRSTGGRPVPIRQYLDGHQFDPDTIRVMGRAFEILRAALHIEDQNELAKEVVAERIIELARQGECDPNHLSELVLAELRSASSKSA